jgi:hypothetical protein
MEVIANSPTPGVAAAVTTLASSISSTTATSITTNAAAAGDLLGGSFRILIDSEIMLVTAGQSGTTWTVVRGVEGSTAATHSSSASIYHVFTAAGLRAASAGRQAVRNAALGFTDQTFDLFAAATSSGALATQRVVATMMGLYAGDIVSNIFVSIGTVAVSGGTTPSDMRLGLFTLSGTQLAETANLNSSSIWTTAQGIFSFALATPYQVPTTGGYYLAAWANGTWGTTQLALEFGQPNGNVQKSAVGNQFSVIQGAQTTFPTAATWTTGSNAPFWFAFS